MKFPWIECRIGRLLANGVSSAYNYDAGSQLLSLVSFHGGNTVSSHEYGYDLQGNRTSKTNLFGNWQYDYDAADRLVQAVQPLFDQKDYSYDSRGNRMNLIDSHEISSYTVNNLNQITQILQGGGTTDLSWDMKGNLSRVIAESSGMNCDHDAYNRLGSFQRTGENPVHFSYDPSGRRIAKTQNGKTLRYTYDGNQIVEIRNGLGEVLSRFVYGSEIDEPVSILGNSGVFYYLQDGLGSISEITDADGTVMERYAYDAFGSVKIYEGQGEEISESTVGNPYYFTGRELDRETGLYYYRARYYDATLGRFLETDPAALLSESNLYTYVRNNPVTITDPWGEKPGDKYNTEETAAKDAIKDINSQSIKESREYGGYIYRNKDGTYSYTSPVKGSQAGLTSLGNKPKNTTADYHTHGSNDPGYDNNNFSKADKKDNKKSGLNGYLGTPSRDVKKYDPSTGKESKIGTTKPKTKKK